MRILLISKCLYFLVLLWSCQACQPIEPLPSEKKNQITAQYAHNFSIERHSGYQLLSIRSAWKNSNGTLRYVLYPRDKPRPLLPEQENIVYIPVPVQRIVCTSTVQAAMLEFLGLTDKIVAMADAKYVYNTQLLDKVRQGAIVDLGNDQQIDFEKLVAAQPDLVLGFGLNEASKLLRQCEQMQIPNLYLAEYTETEPLGRAEWVRVLGALFGKSAEADSLFQTQIVAPYQKIQTQAQSQAPARRPTVFTGIAYEGRWYVAGGKSHLAQQLQAAGGAYLWADNPETGGLALDFEQVYAKALQADIWLNVSQANDLQTLAKFNPHYADFKAYQTKQVYSYSKRVSPNGGYDIFESAIVQPQLVLRDISLILNPSAFPNDTLFYYEKLE
jgi:iron complex transport system substrate-binding protein